jgi:hypothetical protein
LNDGAGGWVMTKVVIKAHRSMHFGAGQVQMRSDGWNALFGDISDGILNGVQHHEQRPGLIAKTVKRVLNCAAFMRLKHHDLTENEQYLEHIMP